MNLSDAKIVLGDILDNKILDSLLIQYKSKDSLENNVISLEKSEIIKMQKKSSNQELQIKNLGKIITDNGIEIKDLDSTITAQKKEIRKQKLLKVIGFAGDIILPVLVIVLLH